MGRRRGERRRSVLGCYHAFKAAAVARLPLAAVILINPLTFFWKEGMSLKYPEHRIAADMARYRSSTLQLSSWIKLLSGGVDLKELAQVLARRAEAVARKPIRAIARLLRIPLQDDLPTELLSAVHKTDLQFVFAASDPGVELLRDQGGVTAQRLRTRHRIGVELIEGADHTFTDLAARLTLAKWVVEHLAKPVGQRTERAARDEHCRSRAVRRSQSAHSGARWYPGTGDPARRPPQRGPAQTPVPRIDYRSPW